jgi:hypothetical protein
MNGGTSWRSAVAVADYANHDYADFAQEFLRRNAGYQRDFDATELKASQHPKRKANELEGLARRWGLTFPDPTERIGD